MTDNCKSICINKLNDYIKHIKYMLEDLENDGEVSISTWNKYKNEIGDFENTWPEADDEETTRQLKEAVIKVLNNRIEEINKEIENI